MIKYNFKGKNVIITGGSMGLGKATATEFARAGATIILADINKEEMDNTSRELQREFNVKVLEYIVDVSNYNEVESMVSSVYKKLGRVDILINNAGICKTLPLEDTTKTDLDKMIKVNLNGTFYFCKCVLPIMKKQRYGKVVNLSSIAAKLGSANASVYSATKAGVLELTACLAREYAEYDVNINCVLPGIIRTPLWNQMLVEMTEENHANKDAVFKSYTDTIPMKRPQEPVDIANAILFLCTDEASNITAQNLGIDGGHTY